MNTLTKTDLEDMTLILEDIVKRLPDLKLKERIDVAARVRAAGKHIEVILNYVKNEVKAKRDGEPGTINGEQWKAELSLVKVNRLNQALLKEQQPKIHARYTEVCEDERVTFAPR